MIRRKVVERLQARRRAGGGSVRASSLGDSTPDALFSASAAATTGGKPRSTERTNSEEDFLFVDDRDGHSDSADDVEDHEALWQAVPGDDVSGIDEPGVLLEDESIEESVGTALSEDSPPHQKLSPLEGRVRAGAKLFADNVSGGDRGLEDSVKPSVKPWQVTSDKNIYEQQLMLMQEQLTSAMIEKEELKST